MTKKLFFEFTYEREKSDASFFMVTQFGKTLTIQSQQLHNHRSGISGNVKVLDSYLELLYRMYGTFISSFITWLILVKNN